LIYFHHLFDIHFNFHPLKIFKSDERKIHLINPFYGVIFMVSTWRLVSGVCLVLGCLSVPAFSQRLCPSALDHFVYQIRDPETCAKDFRLALEKIGEYLALEVREKLDHETVEIETLLGKTASHSKVVMPPVLVTILRAGVPLCTGVQNVFPDAEVGFIAMSRNEETLQADVEYVAIPDLKDKDVVLVDTMIATGGSIIDALKLIEMHSPSRVIVVGAIASQPGIERIHRDYPAVEVIAAAVDPSLNEKGYIVPGLGDAGDRSYGHKKKR
jgi:uracil phosphoribosyltransferase